MTIETQLSGTTARVKIFNSFDSSAYTEFKAATDRLISNNTIQTIEIDVSSLEYMDSAALGMLMLLDEKANREKKSVTLISVPGRVSDILKMANADKLFSIKLPSGIKLNLRKS